MQCKFSYCGVLLGGLWLAGFPGLSHGQNSIGTIEAANPNLRGDGTLGAAATAAMRGPLPMSEVDIALKQEANHASRESTRPGQMRATGSRVSAESGGTGPRPAMSATIVEEHNFGGLASPPATGDSPINVTGAIGPTRYVQAANDSVRIYGRDNHRNIATAKLNRLAGLDNSVTSFNPQIIWDPTTNRFYYVMDSVVSAGDNKLSFGFSKTPTPNSLSSTDWCQYTYTPADAARFPDYPRLGDSKFFIIIGVNSYKDNAGDPKFVGSDLIAIGKPGAGTACPDPDVLLSKSDTRLDLRDAGGKRVFTPVPSNQVDDNDTGYVLARGALEKKQSNALWFFNVTRNSNDNPVFGSPRRLAVEKYEIPPDAAQPDFAQLLETLDARPTQAVQAINPNRRGVHSFWVQHTIRNAATKLEKVRSIVRWYEIDPVKLKVLRKGDIGTDSPDNFYFNAAISPDRRKDGNISRFGNSFVIEYNVSSRDNGINPRIVAGSSLQGKPLTFLLVQNGVGGYKDTTCREGVCRWADYSSASPDPRPTTPGRGQVWGTNQWSGKFNSSTKTTNFRTRIFAVHP